MPPIPLVSAYNGRPRVGQPSTRLINALVERTEAGPSQVIRTTRPGLVLWNTVGTGPILRMYQNPGLFNGDLFSISGGNLYRNANLVSAIAYGTNPRMAAANNQLAIVSGGALYVYQNGTLSPIRYFDDGSSRLPSFSSIAVLYDIFIYTVAGSNEFYFSSVGDATVINAANFSAAQTSPDPIVEVQVLAEELYFFKSRATEIWNYTGALTAPFALSQGRTYSRGSAGQNTVVTQVDNSIFWVADNFAVYHSGNIPVKVSTPFIDDRLQAAGPSGVADIDTFYLAFEGHEIYLLHIHNLNESYAYDAATKEWCAWGTVQSYSSDPGVYIGGSSAGQSDSGIFVGDHTNGNIYKLSSTTYSDNGKPLGTIVSGAILMEESVRRCNNVSINCVRGEGTNVLNPSVWMRFSDDGGRTWSSWLEGNLGLAGQYDYKATWRYLGHMDQPGRYFEWWLSDTVPFTVQSATYNEPRVW